MRRYFRSGKQRLSTSRSAVPFLLAAIVIAYAGWFSPQPAEANEFQYAAVRPYEPVHKTINAPEAIQWHQGRQKIRTELDPANPNRRRIVATGGQYAGREVFIDPNNNIRPIDEFQRAKNIHDWMNSGQLRELYGKDSQGKTVFAYEFVGQENHGLYEFDANGNPRKSSLTWPAAGRPAIPDAPVAMPKAPSRTKVSAVRLLDTRPADAAALKSRGCVGPGQGEQGACIRSVRPTGPVSAGRRAGAQQRSARRAVRSPCLCGHVPAGPERRAEPAAAGQLPAAR